jgi:hypothetical protein
VPLPIERSADDIEHGLAQPVEPHSPFGNALALPSRGGIGLAPVMLTWELAIFLVIDAARNRSAFAAVPGHHLGGFIWAHESGALDEILETYLAGRPSSRRLLRPEQGREPGLFDELGLRVSLLALERDYWGRPMQLTLTRRLPRGFHGRLAA